MDCEMCGKPIKGNPIRIKIDGAVMDVCKDCSKFGKVQKVPRRSKFAQNKKGKNSRNNTPKRNYSRNDEPTDELVEDYGSIIKHARESQKLSRKELGQKINEKVSVITNVESEKMEPDLKLAKKFEKELNIKLIEKAETLDLESFKNLAEGRNSLANVVKFKKPKK
ncbi:MAG: multiprotein bridging factor aMBF1 [Methanobrevibacter wolinii]|uniref:multiprotein bridging factor aMBF1 n=1 Tax=Methanobrevibacter wolinii TaxID=190977 RepID=UPI0005B293EC|nr:multiprotein bridging factor aMBF1 [Methanobrevibacter wolinii]MDD5959660.1 multiprotein bridging factor aMBF1 [Methanobrevibacter wolinii]